MLSGLRVLVVDDNETNRQIIERQIANWGISSASASSASEAWAALRERANDSPFDVAILDLAMPGMDGLMLAQLIKTDPAIAKTRLLMMSSIGNRGEVGADLGPLHRLVQDVAPLAAGHGGDQHVHALSRVSRHGRCALARLVIRVRVHGHQPQRRAGPRRGVIGLFGPGARPDARPCAIGGHGRQEDPLHGRLVGEPGTTPLPPPGSRACIEATPTDHCATQQARAGKAFPSLGVTSLFTRSLGPEPPKDGANRH